MTQITFFQVCSVLIILSSSGFLYRINTLVEGKQLDMNKYEGKERTPCHLPGGYLLAFRRPYPGSVTGEYR
jgi:hypothetical protein